MEPVPYHIREEDIDEVLTAYEAPDDVRSAARAHVLSRLVDIDEVVRTGPETPDSPLRGAVGDIVDERETLSDFSPARREIALASIEDELIRGGFVELSPGETRMYPVSGIRDSERDDA